MQQADFARPNAFKVNETSPHIERQAASAPKCSRRWVARPPRSNARVEHVRSVARIMHCHALLELSKRPSVW